MAVLTAARMRRPGLIYSVYRRIAYNFISLPAKYTRRRNDIQATGKCLKRRSWGERRVNWTPIVMRGISISKNIAVLCVTVLRSAGASDSGTEQLSALASIARDDPSTLPGDDPFPRARMHRDRNAR